MSSNKALKRRLREAEKNMKRKGDAFAVQTPTIIPAHDDDDTISLSLKYLDDRNYGFGTENMDDQSRLDLLSTLMRITRMTWEETIRCGKHNGGSEVLPIEQLKVALPACLPRGLGNVTVFRFNGQSKRIIGYRQDLVFYPLFIDAKLELYNH